MDLHILCSCTPLVCLKSMHFSHLYNLAYYSALNIIYYRIQTDYKNNYLNDIV